MSSLILTKPPLLMFTSFFALTLLVFNACAQSADEVVCFRGFVMDVYCIQLGTLLDRPDVESLRHPELHSYHCLVDVDSCLLSGYEVLADVRETSGGLYSRFLRLDNVGNQGVIQLVRATGLNGPCGTCTGISGNETLGFRATVIGKLVPDSGTPQLFETQTVLPYDEGCPENITEIDPNTDPTPTQPSQTNPPTNAPTKAPVTLSPVSTPAPSATSTEAPTRTPTDPTPAQPSQTNPPTGAPTKAPDSGSTTSTEAPTKAPTDPTPTQPSQTNPPTDAPTKAPETLSPVSTTAPFTTSTEAPTKAPMEVLLPTDNDQPSSGGCQFSRTGAICSTACVLLGLFYG